MILDSEQKKYAQDILDESISFFGKQCRLIYQPKYENCGCNFSGIGNKLDNVWHHGGPASIMGCVYCGGTGKRPVEISENLIMILDWNPSQFLLPAPQSFSPYDIVQSKGFLSDLPKILKCMEMRAQLPIEPYIISRYKLYGQPGDQDNIIQNRYFLAIWERIK